MIEKLSGIKLNIGEDESVLVGIAQKKLGAKPSYFRILKKSLDARNKNDIFMTYSIEFSLDELPRKEEIARVPEKNLPSDPIVIVGAGPCGLSCAVRLIDYGIKPIVAERGDAVDDRIKKTELFAKEKILDEDSNIQFGEGGAGTFSDGKLNTQTHSGYNKQVFDTFIKFGAPAEIAYLNKPHIGSDKLRGVVKNMRTYIENNGGKVLFRTKLVDISAANGRINSVTLENNGKKTKISPYALVLAVGHSARDTFYMLKNKGVNMRAKDFAVGLRIEHLQKNIGFSQYGKKYPLLPAADYKLVSHAGERACFSFCMCPGGFVMPAASEANSLVTNGMSNYARSGLNANSALIVPVTSADFHSDDPLSGVEFQRDLERKAFIAGGADYNAPVQLVGDFLANKKSTAFGLVQPTYPGTRFAEMNKILPAPIISSVALAIKDMDKKLRGFADKNAVLTAVESRTSSPVRIERQENLTSPFASNLYPCGEGAGYSGGITSSSADGLRVADEIAKILSR